MTAPFGIDFFSPIDQFSVVNEYGEGKFAVLAPKPHPAFVTYIVQATPDLGVTWVKGITASCPNDAYGSVILAVYERLRLQLGTRYGASTAIDILQHGSIWNEARDWMQGLFSNERTFAAIWERGGATTLPEDISSVFLGVTAVAHDEAHVCVEYSSSRMKQAEGEIEAMLADLL